MFGKEDLDNANKGTCLLRSVGCVCVQGCMCVPAHVMIIFRTCFQKDSWGGVSIPIFRERETALC